MDFFEVDSILPAHHYAQIASHYFCEGCYLNLLLGIPLCDDAEGLAINYQIVPSSYRLQILLNFGLAQRIILIFVQQFLGRRIVEEIPLDKTGFLDRHHQLGGIGNGDDPVAIQVPILVPLFLLGLPLFGSGRV